MLERSAQTQGALLDALGGFGAVLDAELKVVQASHDALEAFGDCRGRSCHEAFKSRPVPCDPCPAREALASGQRARGHEIFRDSSGADWRVFVAAAPLHTEAGGLAGVVLTEDLHQVRELKRELAEREDTCHTLFEEVPCFVSVQDRDLRVVQANRQFRDTFLGARDRPGTHCYELYKHRAEPCLPCPVAATFEDGQTHSSEETVTTRGGRTACVLVTTAPLRDTTGEVTHVMEMSTDITEFRRTQSQLEGLGMLVGQIAHEIKGVLNGLDGGIYMVTTGMERHDEGRLSQGWQMLKRNVDRVRTLVRDILYYAKDRQPERKLAAPLKVAEDVVRRFAPKAGECGVTLEQVLDPAAIRFEVDVRAIEALLTNLLENALDACRADSEKDAHTIALRVHDAPEHVVLEVADDGIGMDQETREKSLTPFFSSKGSAGTGLGLHIAQRIAAQHDGSVGIESALGEGTTVVVRLPKASAKRKRNATEGRRPPTNRA